MPHTAGHETRPSTLIQCPMRPMLVTKSVPLTMMVAVVAAAVLMVEVFASGGGARALAVARIPAYFIATLALALGVAFEVRAFASRFRTRRVVAELETRLHEDAAILHTLRARSARRNAPPVNAGEWLRTIGPGAVSFGVPIPDLEGGDPIAEPVDVGPGRRRRRRKLSKVTWLGMAIGLQLFGMAMMVLLWFGSGMPLKVIPGSTLFLMLLYVPMAINLAAEFGYRPIELTSAIAEPGRLSSVAWGRRAVFTREDSVLVLEPFRREVAEPQTRILAQLVRRDGRVWAHLYADYNDPGLADLYYRWMADPGAPATWPGPGPLRETAGASDDRAVTTSPE